MKHIINSCPISGKTVNQQVIRLTAAFIFCFALFDLLFPSTWLPIFILIDFIARAWVDGRGSLLKGLAVRIVAFIQIPKIMVDSAAKQFAAVLGAVLAMVWVGAALFHLDLLVKIVQLSFLFFSGLESAFSVCVGCIIYKNYQRMLVFFSKKKFPTQ